MSSAPSDRPRLRLRNALDVAATVPYLFGYFPSESLVLIGIQRGRVALSMRMDLTQDYLLLVESGIAYFKTQRPHQVVAVISDASAISPGALAATLRRAFAREAIGVQEIVLVRDGRCYSLMCAGRGCCPRDGWPMPVLDELEREMVAASLGIEAPLESREALQARVRPVVGPREDRMRATLAQLSVPSPTWEQTRDCVDELLASLECAPDGSGIEDEQAAWLIVATQDRHLRDHVVAYLLAQEQQAQSEQLMVELTRLAVDDWCPPVATAAGLIAWQRGSGTRARIAIERALEVDPSYTLALLIETSLDQGMPPAEWAEAFRDLLDGGGLQG